MSKDKWTACSCMPRGAASALRDPDCVVHGYLSLVRSRTEKLERGKEFWRIVAAAQALVILGVLVLAIAGWTR